MNTFNDYSKVYDIVESAYKKMKTYYYYDNTLLFMKKKIAEVEYNSVDFKLLLNIITEVLCYPRRAKSIGFVNQWVEKIDFYALPKSFKTNETPKDIVTNVIDPDSTLEKVNMYIDAPIALHILDIIWCMYIGKFAKEKELFSEHSYAYKFHNYLFNDSSNILDSFNIDSTWLFENYYNRYSLWRDNAINEINERYKNSKNSLLLSLDIKSYYYVIQFKFKKLGSLLVGTDYKRVSDLTKVIEKAYIKYSNVLSEYRKNMMQNTDKLVLPIGFLSSGVISNLYLNDFDETIIKLLNPIYYGRYVDDILIVIKPDKKVGKDYNVSQIIKETLIAKGILIQKDNDVYIINEHEELTIQKDKVRVLYIDSQAPSSILDMISKDISNSSSEANLLPDINNSIFNQTAYKYDKNDMVTKLRDLDILNKDKYNAVKYISNQLWKNHNIKIAKTKEFKSELQQICSFFSGNVAIELYASWIKIFSFYLISAEKVHFQRFYKETKKTIKGFKAHSSIQDIKPKKKALMLAKVRNTLNLFLDISVATASALDIKFLNENQDKLKIDLAIMLRKSNLFNHHLMSFPMINFTNISNNIKVSFLKQDIEYYSDLFKESTDNNKTITDEFLINYSPRFIHLDEFFILTFIKRFHTRGWNDASINNKIVEHYFNVFGKINEYKKRPFIISPHVSSDEKVYGKRYLVNKYEFNNYSFTRNPDGRRRTYKVIKPNAIIAFGNVKISESECIDSLIRREKRNNTHLKKMKLYGFLKVLTIHKADIFIMPELYVPISWLKELADYSRKTQKALIFGLEYIKNGNTAHNHIVNIIPSVSTSGFKMASVLIREKNNYSPIEKIELAKYGLTCVDQENPTYNLYSWKGIDFTCFNCYEMTDIVARSFFKSQVDILFAVEYNKDTNYFSSIVDSTARDLHCFIVQSNTSQYGDSRITSPNKTELKDVLKIKGGDNDTVLIGTINVKELNDFQSLYNSELEKKIREVKNPPKRKTDRMSFKPLPANYVPRDKQK